MTPAARVSAAIDVVADIIATRRPAADALKDWGLSHRFAGSGDRAALAGIVYAALRVKSSAAWIMRDDTPRAIVLGSLRRDGMSVDEIARLFDGSRYAPAVLSDAERQQLDSGDLEDAPACIRGDYPEWLEPHFDALFGEARVDEGAALAKRAPIDLRVNTLKAEVDGVADQLAEFNPVRTPWSPLGLRIRIGAGAKSPALHVEPSFLKGHFEIQDEGSQVAALLAAAAPGEQVVDLCAGAGGKTLALAAAMNNAGQLYATDLDKRRLAPIHVRIERAGVRNAQVITPGPKADHLARMSGKADLVLVDAPCTGVGAWRRNPDAKWRIRPSSLERRLQEQVDVLDRAAGLVRPGGRLAYITCSILDAENGAQVRDFLNRHPAFTIVPPEDGLSALGEQGAAFVERTLVSKEGILMTPRLTQTDGFFVSLLRRSA